MAEKVSQTLYEKIGSEEDARACKDIDDSQCKIVAGNFFKILLAQFLSKSGDALMNPKITLPWVMQSLGVPAVFLGWLVPIRESGSMLPQLIIASFVRRLAVRHNVWVVGSLLMSLSMVAVALTIHFSHGMVAGWLIILFLSIFSLSRGLNSVAFKDVLGKTVEKKRRGRISGFATSGAGLVTVIVAVAISLDVAQQHSLTVYTLAFVLAAVCWTLGALIYSRIIEEPGAVDGGRNGFWLAFKRLSLLFKDKPFGYFVLARALMLCSALSAPYYVAIAQQQGQSTLLQLSFFLVAGGVAELVSGPFWGWFADLSSRKVMIIASLVSAVLGALIAISVGSGLITRYGAWLIPGAYFLLTIAHQGVRLGRKTYLVNLGKGNKRTDYVSVSNTLIGAILLFTGFISLLQPLIGLGGILAVLALMGFLGALLATKLPEV
ncbi:MFS transporter [Celerinatantimonas sp. MCCC 1A17872]|uniref:MFS transporter n=1 Tax=Celerinatantimonas sp. MCCC 1A17872 TaxID=3177514 RepID=UPI0038CBD0BA